MKVGDRVFVKDKQVIDDKLISETNRANMFKIAYSEVNTENKLLIKTLDILCAYIYNGCKEATYDELSEIYKSNLVFIDDMERTFVEMVAKHENDKKEGNNG